MEYVRRRAALRVEAGESAHSAVRFALDETLWEVHVRNPSAVSQSASLSLQAQHRRVTTGGSAMTRDASKHPAPTRTEVERRCCPS